MAPSKPRDPSPPAGFLSNVFGFVSRELESFVTTAVGGDATVQTHPQASTSRVTLDDVQKEPPRRKRVRMAEGVKDLEGGPRRRRPARDESESDGASGGPLTPPRRSKKSRIPPARTSPSPTPARGRVQAGNDEGSRSRSPSRTPPPLPALLQSRRAAATMPGSLFPRSESLQPDLMSSPPVAPFAGRSVPLRTPSPIPRATRATREKTTRSEQDERASDDTETDRGRVVAENADVPDKTRKRNARSKSRNRRDESRSRDGNTKEKARNVHAEDARDESDETEVEGASWATSKGKGKERAHDTSGEIRVRGKERELHAAREAQLRNEPGSDDEERERDKQRIRMLEEEIVRLRAQLATRNNTSTQMPPPPPPPPPPISRPFSTGPRISSIGRPGGPRHANSFLASVRANLKPTVPPVEAPINNMAGRTRRSGQPTVNVPSDKMAAFLSEMKTVRLRKVSSTTGSGAMLPPPPPRSSADGAYVYGERSFSAVEARIGEKRKRDALESISAAPGKRRLTTFAVPANDTGSSTSSQSSYDTQQTAVSSASSLSFPPPAHLPPRTWPSVATTETDITTPSLCSDNENEHDTEERILPPTPPHSAQHHSETALPTQSQQEKLCSAREVIDVDLEPDSQPIPSRSPPPDPPETGGDTPPKKDVFAHRPPRSPLPDKAPRRIVPPARKRAKQLQIQPLDSSARHDPASLSDNAVLVVPVGPDPLPSRLPIRAGKKAPSRAPSRSGRNINVSSTESVLEARIQQPVSNQLRRRRTLDEELRRAGDILWREDDALHAQADLDSGELVGVGTKSTKKGFLKGGGAAGTPVFMGVGYVQGAEDGDDEDDEPPSPPRRGRSTKAKVRPY
ncbi:hypothetical protein IEO21_02556 [Rhodonia placenta]|uniref:Uncharacterized protein n=1 Tax=Rhodonia placenta TaxID=104341 RepID=A0A8H7P7E1_9APHY|nr:hypothetical protein IEO21_02556 [Postia placenta]